MHRASHFITGGNQVGETYFVLGEPMLALPGHLLLRMSRNGFQEDMFHDFPQELIEGDCLVVFWTVFLDLFENLCNIRLSLFEDLSKLRNSSLAMASASSLCNLGCILVISIDLRGL